MCFRFFSADPHRSLPALLLAALWLLPGTVGSNEVRPSAAEASAFIEELVAGASGALSTSEGSLEAREAAFRELLRDGFDMPYIARIALGKHWRRVDGAEREAYVELFSEFVLKTYAPRLGGFQPERFHVNEALERGTADMLVRTSIDQEGGPAIDAAWRVRMVDGKLRIIDIMVEGVSMVINQRNEFQAVVARNGMTGLMELLRARTERLSVEPPS